MTTLQISISLMLLLLVSLFIRAKRKGMKMDGRTVGLGILLGIGLAFGLPLLFNLLS
jgi:hypothetical protein